MRKIGKGPRYIIVIAWVSKAEPRKPDPKNQIKMKPPQEDVQDNHDEPYVWFLSGSLFIN
jgi:hypothetical protein